MLSLKLRLLRNLRYTLNKIVYKKRFLCNFIEIWNFKKSEKPCLFWTQLSKLYKYLKETWNKMRNYFAHIWAILLKTEIWGVWEKIVLTIMRNYLYFGCTLTFLWTTETWEIWKTLEIWWETYYFDALEQFEKNFNYYEKLLLIHLKNFTENWNFW